MCGEIMDPEPYFKDHGVSDASPIFNSFGYPRRIYYHFIVLKMSASDMISHI